VLNLSLVSLPLTISHSLEGLPFSDDEFDFVHVKRIARGVPENKVLLSAIFNLLRHADNRPSGTTSLKRFFA
jgi:hypothetical protein